MVGYLQITSYTNFVFGASHHYGTLFFPKINVDLEYRLDDKRAALLSDKTFKYQPGDKSTRFFDKTDVITAAVEYMKTNMPNDILLLGQNSCYPRMVIYGDGEIAEQLSKFYEDTLIYGYDYNNEAYWDFWCALRNQPEEA